MVEQALAIFRSNLSGLEHKGLVTCFNPTAGSSIRRPPSKVPHAHEKLILDRIVLYILM